MKRLVVAVVVIIAAVVLWQPATGQNNDTERIDSLETRVSVLERLNRKTAILANTPRPTASPVAAVDRLVLESTGSDSQVDHVDLHPGTWIVTLEIKPKRDGYVYVRFDPDEHPEGTRLIFDELLNGGDPDTLTATVYLTGGPGTVSIVGVDVGEWTLAMERQ